ncbi:FecCD family ABC transporter permease [Ureaplasma zalophigenitalium]|uniref:Iron ABC transporter permease n=1 Tax=Ureaplasma zalophigenitalium TaxID=907723 RepID=A0ABT3BP17_9BACT|nr:iron ABC transporter permease [Ureaplasma zalophigenitalium]MCV3753981.1 iron ABC transporter permease [Ureaplasma zalophigenitalium]
MDFNINKQTKRIKNMSFKFNISLLQHINLISKRKISLLIICYLVLSLAVFWIFIWNLTYATTIDFASHGTPTSINMSFGRIMNKVFSLQFLEHDKFNSNGNLQNTVWSSIAIILVGFGLSVAGSITQSLTKNPLADSSTLGIVQATVFMVVLAISFNFRLYSFRFSFAFIGGAIAAVMLIVLTFFSKQRKSYIQMTLAGLAVGVFFNTITYFLRSSDESAAGANIFYVLGGPENILKATGFADWKTLWIAAILIGIGLIISMLIAHKLSLLELGDQKAKNLGSAIVYVKLAAILAAILLITPSILLAGNVAFVGLFTPHIIRKVFGVRDFRVLIPLSAVLGATLTSLGLILAREIPSINSSIWMQFIGAPTLAWVGWMHRRGV